MPVAEEYRAVAWQASLLRWVELGQQGGFFGTLHWAVTIRLCVSYKRLLRKEIKNMVETMLLV